MDELDIQWPDAGLERVEAAKQSLDLAGEWLRAQPHGEIVERLAEWFDRWSDADSKWRRALHDRLEGESGFAPGMLRAGIDLGLSNWTGDSLRELVRKEMEVPEVSEIEVENESRRDRTHLAPFRLTSVLLAGAIPMPSLLQSVVPLLVGSPVLVRASTRDRVTAELAASSLAELDSDLGRCIEVVAFEREDRECTASLLAADCVVASGSDETIREIGAQLATHQRFVAYGHRLSLAVVGTGVGPGLGVGEERGGGDVEALADSLSRDVALWDQLGCLSPIAIHVVDPDPSATFANDLALALHHALVEREREWPRGEVETATAAAIRRERAEAEMRSAGGKPVALHAGEGTQHTVVLEADAEWRTAPLHRFVRLHPTRDLETLRSALRPLVPHISAVATAGIGEPGDRNRLDPDLAHLLAELGVSRVCRPGRMQAPPLGWRHDGRPVLLPLARFVDIEAE